MNGMKAISKIFYRCIKNSIKTFIGFENSLKDISQKDIESEVILRLNRWAYLVNKSGIYIDSTRRLIYHDTFEELLEYDIRTEA